MRHLRPADYTVSDWSGGRTVQLSIGPAGERYADRKFLWRISSATVELETSEFTSLPDYERLIAPIRGEMILSHNGGEEILLRSGKNDLLRLRAAHEYDTVIYSVPGAPGHSAVELLIQ